MIRAIAASSRGRRTLSFGFLTVAATLAFTANAAHARRHHHHHGHRHHVREARDDYSPPFSSIVVDANSGAVLEANSADSLRHPASLTKIMTLYLLFERLEGGKIALDSEMKVSEHASEQSPTKLGLRPGQTIAVEDAIKGLVTRSANDAAVTIAEAIGGSEDEFAKQMTRKAHALGMTKTVYRNASGLPDDEQVTTARDQSILGRAIQERFPRYYRYFSTDEFRFRGNVIRNHNHLLGSVDGVDGIKTGYTRASGFNLVTSIRRGNRHLVAVVMGGHSSSSRDATMRGLLAEYINEASTKRTVANITERNTPATNSSANKTFNDRIAALRTPSESESNSTGDSDDEETAESRDSAPAAPVTTATLPSQPRTADATAPRAPTQAPAPLTNGVIATQPLASIPGSTVPLKPVKVKTVVVRAPPVKVASAGPTSVAMPAPPTPQPTEHADRDTARETPSENAKTVARVELPSQPPGAGTGKGILGVLPANTNASAAMAYADAAPHPALPPVIPAVQPASAAAPAVAAEKPPLKPGTWIVQVGALESEAEANKRLSDARASATRVLGSAEPFTEAVDKGDKRLYRARFANLDRDRAEEACRELKRAEISCFAIKN